MGMTIDEAQLQLSMQKFYVSGKDYEAVQVAIDTMRKYQKIQEIINNTDYIQEDVIRYKLICGVVKDGNDD